MLFRTPIYLSLSLAVAFNLLACDDDDDDDAVLSDASADSSDKDGSVTDAQIDGSETDGSTSDASADTGDEDGSNSDASADTGDEDGSTSDAEIDGSETDGSTSDAEIDGSETDGSTSDAEIDGSDEDGSNSDAEIDGSDTDGSVDPPPEELIIDCDRQIPAVTSGVCSASEGSGDTIIIEGTILAGEKIYNNGRVMFKKGNNAKITCVGCDCDAENATVISCPDGVVSPALINAHDHVGYDEVPPNAEGTVKGNRYSTDSHGERYEHRHDWRKGQNGHRKLSVPSNNTTTKGWAELRMLLGGAMSIAGSGYYSGLLRNLDDDEQLEGLQPLNVEAPTFPLGDGSGFQSETCDYAKIPNPATVAAYGAYVPHVSEGILNTARNEFLCLTGQKDGGKEVLGSNSALIHGVGLNAADIHLMAERKMSLVWSPRTNISLYGNTAIMPLFKTFGVNVGLGTDWSASGSINMLHELQCADNLNHNYFNDLYSDYELWMMATYNNAMLMNAANQIGLLKEGHVADIAIFNGKTSKNYRAVIDAEVEDVMLMLRGGKPLVGEPNVVSALRTASELNKCEAFDVCGSARTLCLELDIGMDFATMKSQLYMGEAAYDLFYCDPATARYKEPTCDPIRPNEYGQNFVDDKDGDGIKDDVDNCPDLFNPPRANKWDNRRSIIDADASGNAVQPDTDGDGYGDVCDICPFNPGENCTFPTPNDGDGDGIANLSDNCPNDYNPDQADSDRDGKGDVCDACPDTPNEGTRCPATEISVYALNRDAANNRDKEFKISNLVVTAQIPATGTAQKIFAQLDPDSDGYTDEAYAGLFVYFGSGSSNITRPTVGQKFSVTGTFADYYNENELKDISEVEIVSGSNVTITPKTVSTAEITDASTAIAYESVLVTVQDVTVTDIEPEQGHDHHHVENEYVVDDALRINTDMYALTPKPVVGDQLTLTGVARYVNNFYSLAPRSADDIKLALALKGFTADECYMPLNTDDAVCSPALEIEMNQAVTADTTINVNASGCTIADLPRSVLVPAGESSVAFPGMKATEGTDCTITATYNGRSAQTTVHLYEDTADRKVTDITVPEQLLTGKAFDAEITIDVPAKAGGTIVYLTGNNVTVDASKTISAGARNVTIQATAGDTEGEASITACTDASNEETCKTVTFNLTATPQFGLVIAEVFLNPAGDDNGKEWVKLYNGTDSDINLSTYSLKHNAGTYSLSGTVAAGECFVAGGITSDATNGSPEFDQNLAIDPNIQNGNNTKAKHLNLYNGNTKIDSITYGQSETPLECEGTDANLCKHPDGTQHYVGIISSSFGFKLNADGTWSAVNDINDASPNSCL